MEGISMSNDKDTKINFLERFGDSDHQDLVAEIRKLRNIIKSFYGENVDFSMFEEDNDE